jgi:hypothetical protein
MSGSTRRHSGGAGTPSGSAGRIVCLGGTDSSARVPAGKEAGAGSRFGDWPGHAERQYHSGTRAKRSLNVPVRQSHTSTRNAEACFCGVAGGSCAMAQFRLSRLANDAKSFRGCSPDGESDAGLAAGLSCKEDEEDR